MVAALKDQGDLANTDAVLAKCLANNAAKLCRDIGPEWFLSSRVELRDTHFNKNLLILEMVGRCFYTVCPCVQ